DYYCLSFDSSLTAYIF
nr:immunoglobulin light chain junction region [Macaca mulatta]MOW67898.1 immunoglobulin light chain junction region [Macaca mulatta]MOW68607.1 immunoglobulin light chain junction region [Macaca mulatta]MOW69946.1 immunoglobulin light chain junction region [Macaca mulatta]MOW71556.1 immunoglobulin light chain junction region [Macaca mulatta]